MTLLKSLLLGSAAGIVAIASAQAADLPTKKGAPAAEYVKVCKITVNGTPVVGFTLPGSDTCLKIHGYVSAQYTFASTHLKTDDAFGFYTRGRIGFDAVSNTSAGPLFSTVTLDANYGAGIDGQGDYSARAVYAYIQWAGLTAGRHQSFFDFLAGGAAWDDFISPDHSGTGTNLLAYTATLGGGFSATLSLESPQSHGGYDLTSYGVRSPDFVLNLSDAQSWGKVQLSGVAHYNDYYLAGTNTKADTWGWGVLGGVTINLPGLAGSDFGLQAVYTSGATAYSGWDSFGSFNYSNSTTLYSGGPLPLYDVNGNGKATTAGSVAAQFDFKLNPQFTISPELSYGWLDYANHGPKETAWLGGAVFGWTPVNNLTFNLDLLYISGNTKIPANSGYYGPTGNWDGFNGKIRIERDF